MNDTEDTTPSPESPRLSVQSRISAFGTNAVFASARNLPGLMRWLIPFFVRVSWWTTPKLRENTMANARHLLGDDSSMAERRRLAKRVIHNSCQFVADMARAEQRTLPQMFEMIETLDGQDHYESARQLKKGLIVATAHLGSYEVGIASLRQREDEVHVVFQRDPLPRFEAIRSQLHHRLGVHEVPVDDGMATWVRLRDALARDEVIVMQADRVMPGQKGHAVPFFDGHLSLPLGPLKMAKLTGAPILPVFAINQGHGKVRIVIEPAIGTGEESSDADRVMAKIGQAIERVVRAHPQQWMLLEKAWLEDQSAESSAVTSGDVGVA